MQNICLVSPQYASRLEPLNFSNMQSLSFPGILWENTAKEYLWGMAETEGDVADIPKMNGGFLSTCDV